MTERFPRLDELKSRIGGQWPALENARSTSTSELRELENSLLPSGGRALAEDAGLVLFGSFARGEYTSQSDLDWILLIDGQVDQEHFLQSQNVRKKLKDAGKIAPGATNTFGDLAFSHDVVQRIGGQDDTNKNLTLRMLLLLESISIGNDDVRQRVIRAVLRRYLADDPSLTWSDAGIPRFLLNDIVRFWRTMAVDFADKFHDQAGEKWALRNAKLRFSRKLLALTGMLSCFSWQLHRPTVPKEANSVDTAMKHFETYLARPPLEIVADELLLGNISTEICRNILTPYNEFLGILDDEKSREELRDLPRDIAQRSGIFQHVRELSHAFQGALTDWLFAPDTELFRLVKQYGIF